jgi:release factor glutamine methyltransferase
VTAVRPLLDDATGQLAAAGLDSPRVDAELLLAHAAGVKRSRLALLDHVDDATAAGFAALVERRVNREPLQYIVGRAAFRYLDLAVGPGVFVPRPETELLVDAIRPHLGANPTVVDLCSGSGALALAVADEVPDAKVYAVERFAAALAWLRRNAAESTNVAVVEGDVTDPALLADLHGGIDVVLSNPPYVPAGTAVAPEVRADPHEAVFAGADGLAVIPAVIARAAQLLRPGGRLAMEHDDTHGEGVPDLLRATGEWRDVADHRDLAGRPRYVSAVRAAAPLSP